MHGKMSVKSCGRKVGPKMHLHEDARLETLCLHTDKDQKRPQRNVTRGSTEGGTFCKVVYMFNN